jgi:hypothetical protein
MWEFFSISPYSIEVYRRFKGAYYLHRPDEGGSMHLRNVGIIQRDYMVMYPRRLSSHKGGILQFLYILFLFLMLEDGREVSPFNNKLHGEESILRS